MTDTAPGTIALDRRHVWHPFTQAQTAPEPLAVTHGQGVSLFTEDGREILDLISSWWVNLHGHAHPAIAGAIAEQAHRLEQVIFADFTHSPAARLAARLAEVLPGDLDRVFFSDNGSTAVEVALKLAWQYWRNKGEGQRRRFLAFEGSYHGDTFGAMAAGVGSGFYEPFHELLFAVDRMPYPATWDADPEVEAKEAAALDWLDRWLAANGAEMVAVIIEPLVQGASGMRFCRPEFLRAMAARVRTAGGLVIFDEVMTGFGRTGALFASHKAGVAPDLICLSKGLTGGFLPLSVTACGAAVYEAFLGAGFDRAFAHGHSFTANPLGCAAALASLDLTTSAETAANLARIEGRHRAAIAALSSHPKLSRGRVMGTIAAIEVTDAQGYTAAVGQTLKRFFLERGLLLRPLGPVIYLLPPYCVTDGQLDRAYAAIRDAADTLL
ncbi:adenosylmethionine--8-amino-7-oxononanoate transaminase (plasmid) [Azospirillum sp. TSH58]|uniref:adenosylmethionine--8-amino-7-oxononanoate transaminase n=1 Tax=Azospirillum sp. TSH58 TaxID=664962 RepID=UPI000D601434|nr:adenosylmethionine--8-amino-7-oxononanoate transaminase [Azospirillum sp. TSH58]AWJ86046.1 adenosylmethionine--8-amino-7-oxononanoate transaminase [Azospirillum sp. TSH58]PWC73263.1 adenosylmethionine-8-amino-7-oxononanoate aminotransferase [Azospirillum sp. TSH58]